ncbi:peroxidase 5-like isoform X2 [Camellia sinensis]|uniref:peroxidase 5-like isoform X2 n=1 Tax=Camellia sinensis TaxID=4442 RepID=UPI0010367CE6|nr:peroxidase 5-like isoform X2 [Camellia sinensis]
MKCLGLLCLLATGLSTLSVGAVVEGLKHKYYHRSCPQAEEIIANMMENFTSADQRVPARIIRMHFHDCFVRGCDGSILLNSTPVNKAEKDAPPNNPSVKGFELIDQIKESGKFERYQVRGGRKDGKISRESDALLNLPPPSANVQLLVQMFANKGLSLEDLVTLSGGHSIGVSHCSSLLGRHVNFSKTGTHDPTLDFHLAMKLKSECVGVHKAEPTVVVMDRFTPTSLDNKYYKGLLQNKGLFTSDQTLLTNTFTRKQVIANAVQPLAWKKKFVDAMIKMGEIEVLTGQKGEIRKTCDRVN